MIFGLPAGEVRLGRQKAAKRCRKLARHKRTRSALPPPGFRYPAGNLAADESSSRVVALEPTSWAQLLFALLSQRFSGRAELDQGDVRRQIVFHGGFAVWTDYEVPSTGVSEILLSAGMLAPGEAEQLRQEAPLDSLDARAAALSLDLVDVETLGMALRDQCEQRLLATAGLSVELTFHDDPGLEAEVLEGLTPARTLRAINYGVRGHCSPEQAEQALEHLEETDLRISRSYSKYSGRFGFDSGEQSTLDLLGSRPSFVLDDLMRISGLDAVRGIQLLYTLWACNMLVEAGSEPDQPAEDTSRGGHSERSLVQDLVVAKIAAGAPPFDILALPKDATLRDIDRALADLQKKVEGEDVTASLDDVRTAARDERRLSSRTIARKAVSDRRWKRAVAALEDLNVLEPGDVDVELDLAWSVWNDADRQGEALARTLDDAVAACGEESEAIRARSQFYRGHLRKHQGRKQEALNAFDRAAKLDPRLLDAQRESRALAGAPESTKSGKQSVKKDRAKAAPRKVEKGPRSKYLSGPWPIIWGISGLLLLALAVAQIMLRLDVDY